MASKRNTNTVSILLASAARGSGVGKPLVESATGMKVSRAHGEHSTSTEMESLVGEGPALGDRPVGSG